MQAFRCNKNKAILLFIDNALQPSDLKNLLPQDLVGLPQGSIILVTTRNLAVTNIFEGQENLIRRPYALQPLSCENAVKVLLKDPTKNEIIEDITLNRIVKICSGVPLALKTVSAQLHNETRLCNILDALENGDAIEEVLSNRIFGFVYGEMEVYSKEGLLDICCYFSKWKHLDAEYLVGALAVTDFLVAGFVTLAPKHNDCLGEELVTPDIIRARGQGLAKRNRFFDVQSLCKVDKQRLHQTKGVWLVNKHCESIIEERDLNLMRRSLSVLGLGGIQVTRVSNRKFENLRFLHLSAECGKLPVKLEKLDKLRVFHGPFFTEGEVTLCKLPKSLLSMKVIGKFDSAECTNTQMTWGPPCTSLEKLDFSKLEELPKLPDGFDQLAALEILILDGIEKMWELPEQICQLPVLKSLSVRKCKGLKCLPEYFGLLTTLTDLDLSECSGLQKLPNSFGQLTALRSLNLSYCLELVALPNSFGQLTVLKDLNLSECDELKTLPDTFDWLLSLQNVGCSRALRSIVQSRITRKGLSLHDFDGKAHLDC